MALPTVDDAKAILRIQHAAEDGLLTQLLARALALVIAHLRRPVTAAARTFYELEPATIGARQVLFLPVYPAAADGLVVKDADDVALEAAVFRLDGERGTLTTNPDESFDNGPYTVTATVGLSARADYDTTVEPLVSAAVLDVAADLYYRRNPSLASEAAGGGVSASYTPDGLPHRVATYLEPLRLPLR